MQNKNHILIKNTGNALLFANFSGKCVVSDNKSNIDKDEPNSEKTPKKVTDKAKENKNISNNRHLS